MPATVATALLTPENLLAAALNALLRLVTDPEVAHETARRAADSLIRYALPKPERTPVPQPSRERELAEHAVRATPTPDNHGGRQGDGRTVASTPSPPPSRSYPNPIPAIAPPKHSAPSHDPKRAT